MKINFYVISDGFGLRKQKHFLGSEDGCSYSPLVYFQRPRWIKDDAVWEEICKSLRLTLPQGFEIK